MTTVTLNPSNDLGQDIEQVYENYDAKLQVYFLRHIGNTSLADDCVRETMSRFFLFMKGRRWTDEIEAIPGYLMRIAGILCSEKLAEKSQRPDGLDDYENRSLFNKLRDEAAQTGRERIQFKQFLLRARVGDTRLS